MRPVGNEPHGNKGQQDSRRGRGGRGNREGEKQREEQGRDRKRGERDQRVHTRMPPPLCPATSRTGTTDPLGAVASLPATACTQCSQGPPNMTSASPVSMGVTPTAVATVEVSPPDCAHTHTH